eukprot:TRINITY_DN12268_c0_g1_i1.p1 TRINITY_DN12268_c0_g1~~TRINITY_DN12268_c0_g1_i1.p1  ORF type:complete len:133 (-),score=30.21 TRINITY_DN12268_c0_g1_i1:37-435(-)
MKRKNHNDVIDDVEQLIKIVYETGTIMENFTPQSQKIVYDKIEDTVNKLKDLRNTEVEGTFPVELLGYLSNRKNLDLYTKDLLLRLNEQKNEANQRKRILKDFKNYLFDDIESLFPEDKSKISELKNKNEKK